MSGIGLLFFIFASCEPLKRDIVTPDVETWIKVHKLVSLQGYHVNACLKTVMQLGKGHNTAISHRNMNDY